MTDKDEAKKQQEEELASIPDEELFRPVDKIVANAPPLYPLWGYFFFRKAVTSLVGDPGISKTTLGYSMFSALSNGQPFLDIRPEELIRVLYMDFESSDSLIASRSELIEKPETPNFITYNLVDYYLPQVVDRVIAYCQQNNINIIVIDNQSMAFNTRDENDNSEAKREMKFIRQIAVACNASIFIYHHPSKANLPGTRKGSGAFARARLADIMINLDYVDEEECKDIICLTTVKNRMVDDKVVWYLKKESGKFVFTPPPEVAMKIQQPTNTEVYHAQAYLLEKMELGKSYSKKEVFQMFLHTDINEYTVNNCLIRLKQQRRIRSPQYAHYQKC